MTLPIPPTTPNPEPTISRFFLTAPTEATQSVVLLTPIVPTLPSASLPPLGSLTASLDLSGLSVDFSSSLEPAASASADAAAAAALVAASGSVSVTGDNGIMPMTPKFDITTLIEEGASALTIASAMKLASAITNYVTAYVNAQVSPIQMQVSSLAGAARQAPATTLSIVPGKLKALSAQASSLAAKTEALNNAKSAAQNGLVNAQQIGVSRVADSATAAQNAATEATNQANDASARANELAADAATAARQAIAPASSQTVAPLAILQSQQQQVIQAGLDEFWDNTSFTLTGGSQSFYYSGQPTGIAKTDGWAATPGLIDVSEEPTVQNELNQRYVDAGGGAWPEYKNAIENRLTPLLAAYQSQVLRQQMVTNGTLS